MKRILEVGCNEKLFTVHYDPEEMIDTAEYELACSDEYEFVDYGDSEKIAVSKEEYGNEIARLIQDIRGIADAPGALSGTIDLMVKKKDGYLKKGAVGILAWYDKTAFENAETYGYSMCALRLKAISADKIELALRTNEPTPY